MPGRTVPGGLGSYTGLGQYGEGSSWHIWYVPTFSGNYPDDLGSVYITMAYSIREVLPAGWKLYNPYEESPDRWRYLLKWEGAGPVSDSDARAAVPSSVSRDFKHGVSPDFYEYTVSMSFDGIELSRGYSYSEPEEETTTTTTDTGTTDGTTETEPTTENGATETEPEPGIITEPTLPPVPGEPVTPPPEFNGNGTVNGNGGANGGGALAAVPWGPLLGLGLLVAFARRRKRD